ncbi:MAG TPA: MMPL family transporter, partial [Solirubrobacterales bacterium]|nr:MMPL family transporter [Solirubrobacterales bacterium]
MRRFATWTTGHRKTVIISWIVALVAMIAISGAVGADYSEEFSLPDSDSKEALDLLEQKFPAQSGEAAQIVFKANAGVDSPAVEKKMERVFAEVEEEPHVSEVASPYGKGGGAAAISDDGKIAYATVQFDVAGADLDLEEAERVMKTAQAAAGDGLQIELGGSPIEEVRSEEEEGFSEAVGLLAAIVVLLLTFGSVVAMGLPIITALFALGVGVSFITLGTHVFNTADFAPQLAFMIGLGV